MTALSTRINHYGPTASGMFARVAAPAAVGFLFASEEPGVVKTLGYGLLAYSVYRLVVGETAPNGSRYVLWAA